MKLTAIVLIIGVALLSFVQRAAAQPFSQVVVFGDSNVDSGYYKALSSPGGSSTYNSLWPSAVADGAGAPTTNPGLLSSQFLAAFFNLSANPVNTTAGTNYATSGAKNVTINTAATGGFTAAIPTVTQIGNFIGSAPDGAVDSAALYFIWSGDNDVNYANGTTGTSPPADPNAYVVQAAEDLSIAIGTLQSAGAQHIIVAGLEYDYPTGSSTTAVNARALKLAYTNALFQDLTQMGVTYTAANTDKVRLAIAANPSNYGFTNIGTGTGQMACTQPNGVTTAWALLCSSNPNAPSTLVSPTAPATDLFADDQHLGTAGQKLMANFLYRQIVPPTVTHNFNVDRESDILWRDTSGDLAIWEMNGGTILNPSNSGLGSVATTWAVVGQRDFNGDGKADILWRDTSGNLAIWEMNGTTILNPSNSGLGSVSTAWSIVGTGDFNGDGMADMLWRNTTTGAVAIWEMNGTTILNPSSSGVGTVATNWTVVGVGDFNGDGMADILWQNTSNGNLAIYLMNGTTVASSATFANLGAYSVVGIGDFNGDGKSDILLRDGSGDIAIWEMNGTAILNPNTSGVGNLSTVWSVAETGDFNGDGMSDILWRDTSGDIAIWYMNGTTLSSGDGLGAVSTTFTIQGTNAD
ncbi:MAG TPA: FG-GAP-like repeat-containing protein [Xanthobacteraceae bacterium]|nr:FG-GAP-like repeat-containing protein [Xanthobacteraceae bacterium]